MKYGGGGEHGGPRTVRAPWSCSSGGELGATGAVDEPPVGRLLFFCPGEDGRSSAETFFFLPPCIRDSRDSRWRARCNAAVRSHFAFFLWSGGIRGRAERAPARSPSPTRCRGSAAGSGARARSCRCPRAGRKPGTSTAECSSSTTTPGKLHGLTPEIGNGNGPCLSGSSGITHFNTHTLT